MKITELRRSPELPGAYFEVRRALEAEVMDPAFLARHHNLASLHAVLAFEIMAHQLRPIGEREIHVRRQYGVPHAVTVFSSVMHGCNRALTLLLRAVDNANMADALPTEVNPQIQDEAQAALRLISGATEDLLALDDVFLGWRDCIVEGKTLRIPSRDRTRFARSIELSVNAEAEANAAYLAGEAAAPDGVLLHTFLQLLALTLGCDEPFEPTDEVLDLAEPGTRRAGDHLSRWTIPLELEVAGRFTVGEYKRVAEVVKAYAGSLQIFDDYCQPRGNARLPVKSHDEWVELVGRRTGVDAARVREIVTFLTHARTDLLAQGTASPVAAHTPFLDLRDGRLALVPTLAIWQEPQLALRTIWKTRATGNYNAKVSALNHQLSYSAGDLFAAKGWPRVVRRTVPGGGDIDAGTGAGDFFVLGECKLFTDDPVREADDPEVWRELERNVAALRDPQLARQVLQQEGLAPTEIVGLVIVSGRGQSPLDFGPDYALVGLDDLRDRVAESATPRAMWDAIKAVEVHRTVEVVTVPRRVGDWVLESDGVSRSAIVGAAPKGTSPDGIS